MYLVIAAAVAVFAYAVWNWAGETAPAPAPLAREEGPLTVSAQVDYVVDGDTIRLTTGEYVRLLGIDAPEAEGQDGTPAECHAAEAAIALQTIAPPGTTITLTRDQTQDAVDHWGRMLAYVGTQHVPDAAEQLLRNGDARFYVPSGAAPLTRAGDYVAAQAAAQRDRAGMWGCP